MSHKNLVCFLSLNFLLFLPVNCLLSADGLSFDKTEEAIVRENTRVLRNVIQAFGHYEPEDFEGLWTASLKAQANEDFSGSDETFQGSSCKPESFMKRPMPQTAYQLKEPDVFKKFRITYTGHIPFDIDILIAKIHSLKRNKREQKKSANSDSASLKNTNSMNTLLLYGEPGNGKSYFVKELARALQVDTLMANGSLLQSSFRHQSATNIKKFFDYAKQQTEPLIVFIDEVDPIAGKQIANNGNNFESTDSLKMLIDQLDEVKSQENLFIISGTNHLYWLEQSFISRFDFMLNIERPQTEQEYKDFFKYSYTQYCIENNAGQSDQLGTHFYNESRGNPGWLLSGQKRGFSRRNLSAVIPFILAKRATECEKAGITGPILQTIDIKNDSACIEAAIKHIRQRYDAEHKEAPLSKEMQILDRATRVS